jgi:hypothetical protein
MNLVKHLKRQKKWSSNTFGPGERTEGIMDHILKEMIELRENPEGIEEWIDIVILALDGAWRVGHSPDAIARQIALKQHINEHREWPDIADTEHHKAIEHIRKK